jgi:hypothetical protein
LSKYKRKRSFIDFKEINKLKNENSLKNKKVVHLANQVMVNGK